MGPARSSLLASTRAAWPLLFLLLAGPTAPCAPGSPRPDDHRVAGRIPFGDDLAAALGSAGANDRAVLAYFTFDGCRACRQLESTVFSEPGAVEAVAGFDCVVVDRDRHPELVRRFGIEAYPTLLVLAPDGKGLHRWSGFTSLDVFRAHVSEARLRLAQWRRNGDWRLPLPSAGALVEDTPSTRLEAPGAEPISGLLVAGHRLWCQQGGVLHHRPLADDDAPWSSTALPKKVGVVRDLAAGDSLLHLCAMNWNRGGPISRYDPERARLLKPLRSVPKAEGSWSTSGLARDADRLFVLQATGLLHVVRASDGRLLGSRPVSPPSGRRIAYLNGLALERGRLLTAAALQARPTDGSDPSLEHVLLAVDPATGQATVERRFLQPVTSVAVDPADGTLYLGEGQRQLRDENHALVLVPARPTIHVVRPSQPAGVLPGRP